MKVNVNVDIDKDSLNEVMVEEMLKDLELLRESIQKLELEDNLPPYRFEDLQNDRFYEHSIRMALSYYMTYNDYVEKVGEYPFKVW